MDFLRSILCGAMIAMGVGVVSAGPPSLNISPNSGGLGTIITIQISPQTPGYELKPSTTARWVGVYRPLMGSDTPQFSVDYAGAHIVIVDAWTARVLIGGGVTSNAPNVENTMGGGSLVGTMTLTTPPLCLGDANFDNTVSFPDVTSVLANFGANYGSGTGPGDANRNGIVDFSDTVSVLANFGAVCSATTLQGAFTFSPNTNAAQWREIFYPDGIGGVSSPIIGPSPPSIFIHRNSLYPNATAPSAGQLLRAVSSHYAVRVLANENPQSSTSAPASIQVDLVAYNSSAVEIDRVTVSLQRVDSDGDPISITYLTPLDKPLIVLDQAVNRANYPEFILLFGSPTGRVRVVPSGG